MRAVFALVLSVCAAAAADDTKDADPLKAVAGDCVVVGFEGKGLKLLKADLRKLPYARRDAVVTGDSITAEFGGKKETRTFKVDNTKTPHHIDLTLAAKDGKTETNYGIYKVEKGVLTICATEADKPDARPTEFKAGRDVFLMALRKRGELEGTYLLTGMERKDLKLTETELDKVPEADRRLVIDDDEIVSMFNGKEDAATFKVDDAQTPRHISLTATRDNKAETNLGLYTFDKGVLTLCLGDKVRPTALKVDDRTVIFRLQLQPRK